MSVNRNRRIRRVGFACVTHGLGLSTSRTFRLAGLSEERLRAAVGRNLADLEAILAWMEPRELRMFRIGSSVVPFASHEAMTLPWEVWAEPLLRALGERFAPLGFRFSMHPGQYTVLNSARPEVARRAAAEIRYSCRILDLMGLGPEHKVVIHGGCVCGDRPASLERLTAELRSLPAWVRMRLALENDEKFFSLAELVPVSEATGVPVVFDAFHHSLRPSPDPEEFLQRAARVWDSRPKVHVSSQDPAKRPGAHAPFIEEEDLAALCAVLPFEADLMVEAKAKEVAALRARASLGTMGCLAG